MKRPMFVLVGLMVVAAVAGCTAEPAPAKDEGERLLIVDANGRECDVTHAQEEYGMEPEYFNFGIGVGHNGEQRAYPVDELSRHEVFNDVYPGSFHRYLAVSY